MPQAQDELAVALSDRYELISEIGQGGFATVYTARDKRHGSLVAIKVLRHDLATALGGVRFTREVQITASLQHPNILPLLDSGEANGVPYYVMPFVDGESLAQRLERDGPLPIAEAVRLTAQIADALQYAHARGFLHRDIKPANILLSHGHAIIADFGVARALDVTGAERLTTSGLALGTVMYMSPEQASGGKIDARADLYALACLLYETLAGSPPFTGSTVQAIMARHAVDPPPSLRTVRPTVSEALEAVIMRGLAKVPGDRHATAAEFRDDLVQAAALPSTGVVRRVVPMRRIMVWAVGAGLVLAVATAAWLLKANGASPLDPNRVVVYPLVLPGDWNGSRSTGEDVSTLIGSAVDGAGPLRWIDGWPLLSVASRNDVGLMARDERDAIARRQRAAFTLSGRIVRRGDSADVILELWDVRGDSSVATPRAAADTASVWRAALQATTQLLPRLIRTGVPGLVSEWSQRSPTAVAHFLLGESAFRRVQLDAAQAEFAQAVAADSTFGLAALRGAQAATWNHDRRAGAALIEVAMRSRLSPRQAAFATGYQAFLRGRADSALLHLQRALAYDSSSAFVWMQLGEVYAHLLPAEGATDPPEAETLERAFRLDTTATYALFHLIETTLRRGDTVAADPLVRRFLATHPDSTLAHQVQVMRDCARGPRAGDWNRAAATYPSALLSAAASLSAGGKQWACPAAVFSAILATDTANRPDADARRWYALVGLQGIQIGRGDTAMSRASIDDFISRWHYGTSLYLLEHAMLGVFPARADSAAAADARQFGNDFAQCSSALRCWLLGLRLAKTGRVMESEALVRRMTNPDKRHATPSDSAEARALSAHILLARGDTSGATSLLRSLLASARDPNQLQWDLVLPMAAERLDLARILIARRQYREAIAVLEVFDSKSLVHLAYLAASLEMRAGAASALGDDRAAAEYRRRLGAMKATT